MLDFVLNDGRRCTLETQDEDTLEERVIMAFTVTFPVDIGTHVIVDYEGIDLNNPKNLQGRFGTIECYQCVVNDNDYIVMVSGYKDVWCGEYLLSKVLIATDKQIEMYKKEMKIPS